MILEQMRRNPTDPVPYMRYRRLGRSPLTVSAVGFGTCQLRMIPEQQALDTLKKGFELGVNFVHTAPDYEGAEDLVAQAIEESGRRVIVFSQGYGERTHFEWLFESTCRKLKTKRLDVFGIACVEDREYLGENVWKKGGIIEFLLEKKQQGRLGSIFCETHGTPEYIGKLIRSAVFDAMLLPYNLLGFHVLSYFPSSPVIPEDIPRNKKEIFPLARQYGIALMLMKPLGGGLMCPGKAFPTHRRFSTERTLLRSEDILRALLMDADVTCVVPGTASVAEAEENAAAGWVQSPLPSDQIAVLQCSTAEMIASLCSRCGHCDLLCSRHLPVSWLFRDAYISNGGSETFETLDRLQYFHLHPQDIATCSVCDNRSCWCPQGIDIPYRLIEVHEQMQILRERGLLPETPDQINVQRPRGPWPSKVISRDIPDRLPAGARRTLRLWLENVGPLKWLSLAAAADHRPMTLVIDTGRTRQNVRLRHEVEPGTRTHFSFEFESPDNPGQYTLRFFLVKEDERITDQTEPLLTCPLLIE
ncbi:MAG: aldo/keto reductase [Gammaproteobacteria bacterium]|nr:aldo/keto reductase [Gammaproteobacteria bacterium]